MAGAPAKLLHVQALVAKEEAVYGTPIALTASTDGIQMQFASDDPAVVFTLDYMNDGSIGPSITSLGQLPRVVPTGLFGSGSPPMLARFPAVAYSASVVPNFHRMLKAAGFDATGSFTGGSEKWVYAPTTYGTGYTSLTVNGYERGEMIALAGALADLTIEGKDGKPPLWTFPLKGIGALPTDPSPILPAGLAYLNAAVPPVINQAVTFVFGAFAANAILKSWGYKQQRKYDAVRPNLQGANICAGYVPSGRTPVFTFTIEATALVNTPFHTSAGFDPYRLRDSAIEMGTVSIKVGTAQYNRFTIAMNQAQVTNVTRAGDGPTATVDVEVTAHNSTPLLNDDVVITCD